MNAPNKNPSRYSSGIGCSLIILIAVAICIAVYTGAWDLGELEDTGWIHHDKITTVFSRDWVTGEYKHCSNVNANNHDEPYLLCDGANLEENGKVFKVRFYGRTYQTEAPFETTIDWRCRRNSSEDPIITCERVEQKQRKN
jgi:hypothetical protein